LEEGAATAIARGAGPDDEQEALDRAAMEFGTD
jgi:argininosuccinate synthase